MDAREGEELVEVIEAVDVADLGDERRDNRGSDARDGLQPPGELAIEKSCHPRLGRLDLALEEIELVEQEPNLKAHLSIELGHRDRVCRGGGQALCLGLTETTMSGRAIGAGKR